MLQTESGARPLHRSPFFSDHKIFSIISIHATICQQSGKSLALLLASHAESRDRRGIITRRSVKHCQGLLVARAEETSSIFTCALSRSCQWPSAPIECSNERMVNHVVAHVHDVLSAGDRAELRGLTAAPECELEVLRAAAGIWCRKPEAGITIWNSTLLRAKRGGSASHRRCCRPCSDLHELRSGRRSPRQSSESSEVHPLPVVMFMCSTRHQCCRGCWAYLLA